jgi:hypothetical protein
MPRVKVRLLELLDDYPVELEMTLDSVTFSVAVGADVHPPEKHYPGHAEMWIDVNKYEPIRIEEGPIDEVTDEIEDLIESAVEHKDPEIPELWERLEDAGRSTEPTRL